jgi:hypothetical protein
MNIRGICWMNSNKIPDERKEIFLNEIIKDLFG